MLRKIAPTILVVLGVVFILFPILFAVYFTLGLGSQINDIPRYPNATPTAAPGRTIRGDPSKPPAEEAFYTSDSLEQVRNFYLDRFKREGWKEFKNWQSWARNTELALYYEKGITLVIVSGERVSTGTKVVITNHDD